MAISVYSQPGYAAYTFIRHHLNGLASSYYIIKALIIMKVKC